jgi:hypothetical protein
MSDWQQEIVAALQAAPAHLNPAIALAYMAQRAEAQGDKEYLARAMHSGQLERAIAAGKTEGESVQRTLQMIGFANPAVSQTVLVGF